ncbi:TetR/AcrR family transcriptional regulator [Sphingopyxis sp.]|jgi:AcrR family transcriptional regulator|uniref:TetR/AcrR family transcriptional regulator n=1 Tax=Sphingopyxis sp. TaxID=1908224 RepID=UPI002DE9FC43|nr:TetR/AcrR family transcriptional regulator [Sphingopyxis sp.]
MKAASLQHRNLQKTESNPDRPGGVADHYLARFELDGLRNLGRVGSDNGTRERLLVEAVNLFAERGYDGCSMRDLANAAGVVAASIYSHFRSKQEILVAALDHLLSEFYVHTFTGHTNRDPRELLFAILRRHIIWSATHRQMAAAYETLINPALMKRALDPRELERFTVACSEYVAIIRELLDEIAGPDPEVDRHTRAHAVYDIADGAAAWFEPDGRVTPEELADQTAILIERIIDR